jgi:hypothetical protein
MFTNISEEENAVGVEDEVDRGNIGAGMARGRGGGRDLSKPVRMRTIVKEFEALRESLSRAERSTELWF